MLNKQPLKAIQPDSAKPIFSPHRLIRFIILVQQQD